MGKVIRLDANRMVGALEDMLEKAESGELTSIAFAGKLKNEDIITGHLNCNFGEHHRLSSEIQLDVIDRMIKANYVTPER
ncbi:hypothetical protein D7D81_12075 [Halocella sp. SP3-1]|nr:hypothetical protein D7D81_12075 [Halocella sp. SP3-1]